MAGRIRTIKPELLEDEKTALLDHLEWRVFVSLLLVADDYGNFRANGAFLTGAIMWAVHGFSAELMDATVLTLAHTELLTLYQVRGQRYGHVTNWEKHQRVDHPGKPRVPDVSEGSREVLANLSRGPQEPLAPDLRPPTSDRENVGSPNLACSGSPESAPDPEPGPSLLPQEPERPTPPADVFAHYLAGWRRIVRGTRPPKFDDKRRRLVKARLAEGHTVDELKAACDGLWASSWHVEKGQTDFGLVMRDTAHVEQFLAKKARAIGGGGPADEPVTAELFEEFMQASKTGGAP